MEPWEQFAGQNTGQVAPAGVEPWEQFSQAKPTFLGEMANNASNAVQAAKDLAAGNFQDFGRSVPGVKGQALADKLMPQGSDGSLMATLRNVGNTVPSDYSGALLEKFGQTPEGKALQVMGGVIPSWNAVSAGINHYANPAIEDATGIAPDNLNLMELAAPAIAGGRNMIKGGDVTSQINTPDISIAKNLSGKAVDAVSLEPKPTVTAEGIRGMASDAFKQADELGGSANPNITNAWADRALALLPQTKEAAALAGESPVSKLVDNIQTLRDQPLSLRGTAEIDSMLGDLASSAVDPKTGKPTAEGRQYYDLQHSLRDVWNNATENDVTGGKAGFEKSQQARDLWAAQSRMGDIERIMNRAEDADNPVTARKNAFRALKNNPNRMRGFTPEETAAINRAADTGAVTNILRVAGSRLAPIGAGVVGAAGGPIGAALGFGTEYAVSGAARALADKLHTSRGNAVLNEITNRQSVQDALNPQPEAPQPSVSPIPEGTSALPAPDTQLLLPQPDSAMQVDWRGNASPQSPQVRDEAITNRQNYEQLGLTPDILKLQDAARVEALQRGFGQSEMGRQMIDNRNIPIRELMKMKPSEAQKYLNRKK